ncbi:MAG: UvrD-helicase domain-containing protein [Clostridia bacterium]|nr:UvrD-helicase domain-containing protein [Clostridia bacterium]
MRLLTVSGYSLDQMLIVTYTRNAADELRSKIRRKLTERIAADPLVAAHLSELPRAAIGTIHSFLLKVIKENYSVLGLSPGVSVIDDSDDEALKTAAAEETVDALFAEGSGTVPENGMTIAGICDVLGGTSYAEKAVISVYDGLKARGFGAEKIGEYAESLEEWSDRDFLLSPWGGILKEEIGEQIEHVRRFAEPLIPEIARDGSLSKTVGVADRLFESLGMFETALRENDLDGLRRAAATYDTDLFKVAGNKNKLEAADRFARIKGAAKENLFGRADLKLSAGQTAASMKTTAEFARGFGRAVAAYGACFEEKKRERGRVDYQDLESFALKLFVGEDGEPTDIARKIGERFRFIFVDEYQDANGVQDAIFRAIGGRSELFLVGDVKQSIYRFRGAEPGVFSRYRGEWESVFPQEGDGDGDVAEPREAGIFMSANFRCARPIVDFSNLVSRRTFPFGHVPFCEEDELIFGAKTDADDPVSLYLVPKTKDGATEEEFTAKKIKAMLGTDPYGTGPLVPDDFAILVPKNESGKGYAKALAALGIPTSEAVGSDLSEAPEVTLALDILRAVDNPLRDGPLAGMMYSSIFGFTLDDLVNLRVKYPDGTLYSAVLRTAEGLSEEEGLKDKCASFLTRLNGYRAAERSSAANVFVEYVFNECGILNSPEVIGVTDGAEKVRALTDLSRKYEDGVFGGLFGFLSYIDGLIETGRFTYVPEKTGSVRIMTIHKAKGLEFPVCIIGKAEKSYYAEEYKNSLQFDPELGIGTTLPGEGGYTKYDTPVRLAIVEKKKAEDREEHMRLLYVAMTRAKYKLIITASCADPDKEIAGARENEWMRDRTVVMAATRPLDHVLGAALTAPPSVCETVVVSGEGAEIREEAAAAGCGERAAKDAAASETLKKVEENFAFGYPYSFLSNLPSKLAVSKLYPEVLDEGEAALPEDGEFVLPDGDMPYPTFMTGTTDYSPAEKGTANHVFMQFCDFDRLAEGAVREEIERLVSKGFMTDKMAELVEEDFIERFIRGGLFARMRNAETVRREFRFNVRLPAAKFTADADLAEKYREADARVTVQGVFDCVFRERDDSLVLVDYKTDAMNSFDRAHPELFAEKLRERHKTQLSYYKEAVSLIFGRAPDETLIWSLPMGEAIEI